MNLLPVLTKIGFSQSITFFEFANACQGPYETAVPGLGTRRPLESPDEQAALASVIQHAAPQRLERAEGIRGTVATNAGTVLVKGLGFERAAAENGQPLGAGTAPCA